MYWRLNSAQATCRLGLDYTGECHIFAHGRGGIYDASQPLVNMFDGWLTGVINAASTISFQFSQKYDAHPDHTLDFSSSSQYSCDKQFYD